MSDYHLTRKQSDYIFAKLRELETDYLKLKIALLESYE